MSIPYHCRICDHAYEPVVSFGPMPLANGFLSADQFADEYLFDLAAAYCPHCGMFQLIEQPAPERMFNNQYAFYSGTSRSMAQHFQRLAEQVEQDYLSAPDPLVVELGSNDGILLQYFARQGRRHVGVEPSRNVAEVARQKGITVWGEFFDEALARRIVAAHGQADVILAANVMCHISNLHSVVAGFKSLLKPEGVVIFEDPYLGDVIAHTTYDQIYDEHVFLFSVLSIKFLFEQHGLELFNIEPQPTHGGSMRYFFGHAGRRPTSERVAQQIRLEQALGLSELATYARFQGNCELFRARLRRLLEGVRRQGKRVVGYAATSKSTTLLNYCGITSKEIEFISDTTPIKQGKFSPGMHIPVHPPEKFRAAYPDYALLFAYNHRIEIMAKEQVFGDSGGRWIVYAPEIQILQQDVSDG